ncbi:MAG: hypothetical protein ABJM43_15995 [Paracoccaceae bacterium]
MGRNKANESKLGCIGAKNPATSPDIANQAIIEKKRLIMVVFQFGDQYLDELPDHSRKFRFAVP